MNNGHKPAFQLSPPQFAHITGWGKALPAHIMPNADIEARLQLEAGWIAARTGIKQRRIASPEDNTTHLAIRAAQAALRVANVLPSEVDFILVATSTPEYIFPSTASLVQDALGARQAGASDLAAACSGFVYALDLAANKIRAGGANTVLVIGAENMSRVLDWNDRKTCVLFGDGAGAVVLQGSQEPGGVLNMVLGSDGSGAELLTLPTVTSAVTYLRDGEHAMHTLYMNGRCVFNFATSAMTRSINQALAGLNLTPADLDLIVPHQANQRILDVAAQELEFPTEKIFSNLDRYGNTSAASIPIALTEAIEEGRLQASDLLGLVGFGGGLSWGAAIIEWSAGPRRTGYSVRAIRRQEQYIQADVRRVALRHWRQFRANSPRARWRRFRRRWTARRQTAVPTSTNQQQALS
ncbi:MAG: ketoacyl-ACP synthase III [Chloroflexi bacterium]|nr:ketoacyl-ACP synthase III [Chloroflexota bacterium]